MEVDLMKATNVHKQLPTNLHMDLLSAFLADQKLRRLSPGTIECNYLRVQAFLKWCSVASIEPIQATRETFLAYLQSLQEAGHKAATLKKDFSALSSFYELLEEQGRGSSAIHVRSIRKKYLRSYKPDAEERQIISIEQAAQMVVATISTRDRAILLLLLKTGIRRGELASLDISDISLEGLICTLKQTAKRSNRTVFFDHEAKEALERWLRVRAHRVGNEPALFLAEGGKRLETRGIRNVVVRAAGRIGLHTDGAPLMQRFGPHCCRHWFTTHLLRAGMERAYVQWLRGDAIREAVDIYYHIDPTDVRRAYLEHIPQLGI